MGQLNARACPVCAAENGGRWTCAPCTADVNLLRQLFRNLQSWRSMYLALEVSDVLAGDDERHDWSLWDVQRIYDARAILPPRMKLAIELCLYENVVEREAAVAMGISPTNPVTVYATVGLTRLITAVRRGKVRGVTWPTDLGPLYPSPVVVVDGSTVAA